MIVCSPEICLQRRGGVGHSAMTKKRCWFPCCQKRVLLVKHERPVPAELRAHNDAAFDGTEVVHDNCRRRYEHGGVDRERLFKFVPFLQKKKAKSVSAPVDNRTAAFLVEQCMGFCQQMRGSSRASLALSAVPAESVRSASARSVGCPSDSAQCESTLPSAAREKHTLFPLHGWLTHI